jgi:hypothetical protein
VKQGRLNFTTVVDLPAGAPIRRVYSLFEVTLLQYY